MDVCAGFPVCRLCRWRDRKIFPGFFDRSLDQPLLCASARNRRGGLAGISQWCRGNVSKLRIWQGSRLEYFSFRYDMANMMAAAGADRQVCQMVSWAFDRRGQYTRALKPGCWVGPWLMK